jgi:hypothetical protein
MSLVYSKTELSSSVMKKTLLRSQDSSVDVEASLLGWMFGFDSWQGKVSVSSLPRQSVSVAHTVSYPVGTGRTFPWVRRLDGETQLPPPQKKT